MKEKITYVCEKCGEEYAVQENAEKCEARHVEIEKITKAVYAPHTALLSVNYPDSITVQMVDGKVIEYVRRGC